MVKEVKIALPIASVIALAVLASIVFLTDRGAKSDGGNRENGAITIPSGFSDAPSAAKNVAPIRGRRKADASVGRELDVEGNLSMLEVHNDVEFLKRAQDLAPDDPHVVILSALWADSVDSEWLDKLESMQPNNALPNLVRASFHTAESNHALFRQELERALNKSDLDTDIQERMFRVLDAVNETGRFPDGVYHHDGKIGKIGLDSRFVTIKNKITWAFIENDDLGWGEEGTAEMGLAWAERVKSFGGLDFMHDRTGMFLESAMLKRFDDDAVMASSGISVSERKNEILKSAELRNRMLDRYVGDIVKEPFATIQKRQFFARLVADGERSALNWLMSQ